MVKIEIKDAKDIHDFLDRCNKIESIKFRCHFHLIQEYMQKGYVYKELGSAYGKSAVFGVLGGAKELHIIDINTSQFNAHKHYFEDALGKNNLIIKEISSLSKDAVYDCDCMLIDTVHAKDHLIKELNLHASTVKDWIAIHDTFKIRNTPSPLGPAVKDWLKKHKAWELKEELKMGAGTMLIQRK